jgi:hypothetical protein
LGILLRLGGLSEGMLSGDYNLLDGDVVEVGIFHLGGILVGGLSLCGSHWDCFSS